MTPIISPPPPFASPSSLQASICLSVYEAHISFSYHSMVVVTVQKAVASNVDGRPETGSRVSRLAGPFVKCVCVSIIELITDFELLELSVLKLVCNILGM